MHSIGFTFLLRKFSNVHRSKETFVPSMDLSLTSTTAYLLLSINLWGFLARELDGLENTKYFQVNLRLLIHKSKRTNQMVFEILQTNSSPYFQPYQLGG